MISLNTRFRTRIISIGLCLVAIEGIVAAMLLLATPSMDKNAYFLGYSLSRLILAAIFLIANIIVLLIAVVIFTNRNRIEPYLKRIIQFLEFGDRHFYLSSMLLLLALIGILSFALFHSNLIHQSTLIRVLFLRMQSIIAWIIIALLQFLVLLFLVNPKLKGLSNYASSTAYRRIIIIGICTIAALFQWSIHAYRINLLTTIPDWYWNFSYRRISYPILFLGLITFTFSIIWLVFKIKKGYWFKIIALIFFGYIIQIAFWYIQGGGFQDLMDFYLEAGRPVYHTAVSDPSFQLEHVFDLEQFTGRTKYFNRTKPPGYLLFYGLIGKLVNPAYEQMNPEFNAFLLLRGISIIFPFISTLVILPIIFNSKNIFEDRKQTILPALLYFLFPSTMLLVLQLDHVLFPSLFILGIIFGVIVLNKKRKHYNLFLGLYLYLCLFVSFSLSALPVFIAFMYLIKAFQQREKEKLFDLVIRLLILSVGFFIAYLAMKIIFDYDAYVQFQSSIKFHDMTKGEFHNLSDYFNAAILNITEYSMWIGFPVIVILIAQSVDTIRALLKGSFELIDELFIAFAATFLALLLLGRTQGEVARLWLFFMPIIANVVANQLRKLSLKSEFAIYGFATIQLVTAFLIFSNQFLWM